jgi:hypothetical protein
MSTNSSVGRSAATQENDRSAVTHKKDRSRLCAFTFADGRQCRTPRRSATRICATSTPKRKPKPSPQNKLVRTYLPSFQQIC